jgi:hypothetical protein
VAHNPHTSLTITQQAVNNHHLPLELMLHAGVIGADHVTTFKDSFGRAYKRLLTNASCTPEWQCTAKVCTNERP